VSSYIYTAFLVPGQENQGGDIKVGRGKTTILVVDDEKHVREMLQRILEDADYNVITASGGQEAIDQLSSDNINLVLLDIRMPVMDGYQTLEHIREKLNIPVIMVTAIDETTSTITSLDLGADDYVKKPFRSGVLLSRIEAKLRRTRN
jgi:DNA-binding response OmpR family regulator